ncbi:MAG TPA: hypothetical protein VM681_10615 [Candidatus Thermoplasmatota archaeon]|nr:hypothetical protein [Candidatus Thermoplasmatota archaeon]
MRPSSAALAVAAVVSVVFAGCLAPNEPVQISRTIDPSGTTRIVDAFDEPLAFAAVAAFGASDALLAILSADADGVLHHATLPPLARWIAVSAAGHETWRSEAADLPAVAKLAPRPPGSLGAEVAGLSFHAPVLLGKAFLAHQPMTCAAYNCGASEPVVEIAADGAIYASGTCCIAQSPPVWVSRDGGKTFAPLRGDVLRESFGIEGDFAIDDAGNVYLFDISLATAYVASWDKDGNHRWTVALPGMPVVDRPWIRAAEENRVFFLYNGGTQTYFYDSTDGGRTWEHRYSFPAPLGMIGQGPERDHLWVQAGMRLYESADGGRTWGLGEPIPKPSNSGHRFGDVHQGISGTPVVDEAGRVWVVYDWRQSSSSTDAEPYHVYAARRDPDGAWHGPYRVSPPTGTHHLPWPAAGRDGTLAMAWYGTLDDARGPNSVSADAAWHVFAAATVNGADGVPAFQIALADPLPVHYGPMNRALLDFLQADLGPDGTLHVAYAENRDRAKDEATWYVRTPALSFLAPERYPNGPRQP